MAEILDGNLVASYIKKQIKEKISERNKRPCLAVVLCNDDPASKIYVSKKRKACEEVGIDSLLIKPFDSGIENFISPIETLNHTIDWLNKDSSIHGILVQLPLPHPLDQKIIFDRINPLKDVDVFNPVNVGLLSQGRPRFIPCTPSGIQSLLQYYNIEFCGKKVCVINRSNIVGLPLQALLIQNNAYANATVTVCHDHTPPEALKEICLMSDIIVVAVGIPNFLTVDMVTERSIVVDVGINRVHGTNKIVGDVDFEPVAAKCAWISKVPGGVGPLTVASLIKNVDLAFTLQGN